MTQIIQNAPQQPETGGNHTGEQILEILIPAAVAAAEAALRKQGSFQEDEVTTLMSAVGVLLSKIFG